MVRKSRFRNFAIGSPMLWIAIFVVVPYIIVVLFSFLTRDPEGIVRWEFTLANYREIISPVFLRVCKNSFILALGTTAITLLTAYPFAYILTRIDENIRRFLLLLMIIPFWTSSLIRTYALIILLKANGILNSLLLSLGLIDEPLSILYTETAVFIGLVYTLLPFMILPLLGVLKKIDPSILQAAALCGASKWQALTRVLLPLAMPGIASGALMVFVMSLGYFVTPSLLGGTANMMLAELIVQQVQSLVNWGMGAAAAFVLLVVTLALYALQLRLLEGRAS